MPLSERTRVMIVDDHLIFRMGLKQVLEQTEEFEVVGEAADGEEAVRVATEVSPDVVVMDVMMPVKDGVEACREIMESSPETRVVMLTASTEENAVVVALAAGATGYLQKETGLDRLLGTMRDVGKGELRVPADAVSSVLAGATHRRKGSRCHGRLRCRRPDPERARDTHLFRPGQDLCPYSRGEGSQGGDRSKRRLQHPGQTESRDDAGVGALGRTTRPGGAPD